MACRFVLAFSSSAQGAGGGRSPISGGGRKERAGLGAVGGGAEGLGAGAEEYWLGNLGLKGPLVSISDSKSVRESSCRSKLVCFSTSLCGFPAALGILVPDAGRGGGGGGGGGDGQGGGQALSSGGAGRGRSSATGGGAGKAGGGASEAEGVVWHSGGGAGKSSSSGGGGGGGKSSQSEGGGGGRSPTRPITAVPTGVGDGAEGGVILFGRGGATEANFFGWL